MSYFAPIIIILFLISFLLMLVGLIAPKISLFWYKKNQSRRLSTLFYGLFSVFCIVLFIGVFILLMVFDDDSEPKIIPKNPEVVLTDSLLKVAGNYAASDQHEQARLNYDKVIGIKNSGQDSSLKVNLILAFRGRGEIYNADKQYEKAQSDYENALKLEKDNISILNEVARLRLINSDIKGSILACDQVLKIDTVNDMALARRSLAREFSDDYDGALADINKALFINPSSGGYFEHRGRLRELLGDFKNACADYHKAASLGADVTEQLKKCHQ